MGMVIKLLKFGCYGTLQLNHVLSHRQFIVLSMGAVEEPDAFFIFVYAKCTVVDRRVL